MGNPAGGPAMIITLSQTPFASLDTDGVDTNALDTNGIEYDRNAAQ
jgi:hypothetical protein